MKTNYANINLSEYHPTYAKFLGTIPAARLVDWSALRPGQCYRFAADDERSKAVYGKLEFGGIRLSDCMIDHSNLGGNLCIVVTDEEEAQFPLAPGALGWRQRLIVDLRAYRGAIHGSPKEIYVPR